jgi:transcriptional regulator with XRE-family HTH domain
MQTMNVVREARIRAKLRRTELAREAVVSYSTLERAERGERVDPVSQQKIADALGVERRELFPEAEVA